MHAKLRAENAGYVTWAKILLQKEARIAVQVLRVVKTDAKKNAHENMNQLNKKINNN